MKSCHLCPQSFPTLSELVKHEENSHQIDLEIPLDDADTGEFSLLDDLKNFNDSDGTIDLCSTDSDDNSPADSRTTEEKYPTDEEETASQEAEEFGPSALTTNEESERSVQDCGSTSMVQSVVVSVGDVQEVSNDVEISPSDEQSLLSKIPKEPVADTQTSESSKAKDGSQRKLTSQTVTKKSSSATLEEAVSVAKISDAETAKVDSPREATVQRIESQNPSNSCSKESAIASAAWKRSRLHQSQKEHSAEFGSISPCKFSTSSGIKDTASEKVKKGLRKTLKNKILDRIKLSMRLKAPVHSSPKRKKSLREKLRNDLKIKPIDAWRFKNCKKSASKESSVDSETKEAKDKISKDHLVLKGNKVPERRKIPKEHKVSERKQVPKDSQVSRGVLPVPSKSKTKLWKAKWKKKWKKKTRKDKSKDSIGSEPPKSAENNSKENNSKELDKELTLEASSAKEQPVAEVEDLPFSKLVIATSDQNEEPITGTSVPKEKPASGKRDSSLACPTCKKSYSNITAKFHCLSSHITGKSSEMGDTISKLCEKKKPSDESISTARHKMPEQIEKSKPRTTTCRHSTFDSAVAGDGKGATVYRDKNWNVCKDTALVQKTSSQAEKNQTELDKLSTQHFRPLAPKYDPTFSTERMLQTNQRDVPGPRKKVSLLRSADNLTHHTSQLTPNVGPSHDVRPPRDVRHSHDVRPWHHVAGPQPVAHQRGNLGSNPQNVFPNTMDGPMTSSYIPPKINISNSCMLSNNQFLLTGPVPQQHRLSTSMTGRSTGDINNLNVARNAQVQHGTSHSKLDKMMEATTTTAVPQQPGVNAGLLDTNSWKIVATAHLHTPVFSQEISQSSQSTHMHAKASDRDHDSFHGQQTTRPPAMNTILFQTSWKSKDFKCPVCTSCLSSEANRAIHIKNKHLNFMKNPCVSCIKDFNDEYERLAHMWAVHCKLKHIFCLVCGYIPKNAFGLKRHHRVHSEDLLHNIVWVTFNYQKTKSVKFLTGEMQRLYRVICDEYLAQTKRRTIQDSSNTEATDVNNHAISDAVANHQAGSSSHESMDTNARQPTPEVDDHASTSTDHASIEDTTQPCNVAASDHANTDPTNCDETAATTEDHNNAASTEPMVTEIESSDSPRTTESLENKPKIIIPDSPSLLDDLQIIEFDDDEEDDEEDDDDDVGDDDEIGQLYIDLTASDDEGTDANHEVEAACHVANIKQELVDVKPTIKAEHLDSSQGSGTGEAKPEKPMTETPRQPRVIGTATFVKDDPTGLLSMPNELMFRSVSPATTNTRGSSMTSGDPGILNASISITLGSGRERQEAGLQGMLPSSQMSIHKKPPPFISTVTQRLASRINSRSISQEGPSSPISESQVGVGSPGNTRRVGSQGHVTSERRDQPLPDAPRTPPELREPQCYLSRVKSSNESTPQSLRTARQHLQNSLDSNFLPKPGLEQTREVVSYSPPWIERDGIRDRSHSLHELRQSDDGKVPTTVRELSENDITTKPRSLQLLQTQYDMVTPTHSPPTEEILSGPDGASPNGKSQTITSDIELMRALYSVPRTEDASKTNSDNELDLIITESRKRSCPTSAKREKAAKRSCQFEGIESSPSSLPSLYTGSSKIPSGIPTGVATGHSSVGTSAASGQQINRYSASAELRNMVENLPFQNAAADLTMNSFSRTVGMPYGQQLTQGAYMQNDTKPGNMHQQHNSGMNRGGYPSNYGTSPPVAPERPITGFQIPPTPPPSVPPEEQVVMLLQCVDLLNERVMTLEGQQSILPKTPQPQSTQLIQSQMQQTRSMQPIQSQMQQTQSMQPIQPQMQQARSTQPQPTQQQMPPNQCVGVGPHWQRQNEQLPMQYAKQILPSSQVVPQGQFVQPYNQPYFNPNIQNFNGQPLRNSAQSYHQVYPNTLHHSVQQPQQPQRRTSAGGYSQQHSLPHSLPQQQRPVYQQQFQQHQQQQPIYNIHQQQQNYHHQQLQQQQRRIDQRLENYQQPPPLYAGPHVMHNQMQNVNQYAPKPIYHEHVVQRRNTSN